MVCLSLLKSQVTVKLYIKQPDIMYGYFVTRQVYVVTSQIQLPIHISLYDNLFGINPLYIRGNAANLEDRTMIFIYMRIDLNPQKNLFVFSLQIVCIPIMCKGSIEVHKMLHFVVLSKCYKALDRTCETLFVAILFPKN